MKKKVLGVVIGVLTMGSLCMPVFGDEWDLSEDGQYWMYYGYSDEPLKDEWIEDGGKTYYVDSNGYMKTGWVSNQDDGNRYYMGEDGAMVMNTFTPDDRYVGPEGVVVEKYDTYRKAVKAEINKAAGQGKRAAAGEEESKKEPFFLLTDLNLDGYKDLVVMFAEVPAALEETKEVLPGQETGPAGGNFVEIAVWDVEEEMFVLAAEFDETGEGEYSTLYVDPNGGGIWLEIAENEESLRLFQMEVDTPRFSGRKSFSMNLDDWGGAEYFVDGEAEDKASWDEAMVRAKAERGNLPLGGYLLVNEENVKMEVDQVLSDRDLYLWE